MKNLPVLFTMMMSILLAGVIQQDRSVSILAGVGGRPAAPSFAADILGAGPMLFKSMANLGAQGVQEQNPSVNPSNPAAPAPPADTQITVNREHRRGSLSPVWWLVGALVLIAVIAMISMSGRRDTTGGTTVVRG